jgi:hypothetical protein
MNVRGIFLIIIILSMLSACVVRPAYMKHGKAKKKVIVVEATKISKPGCRH